MRAVWTEVASDVVEAVVEAAAETAPVNARLSDVKAGTTCTVMRLDARTPETLRRLLALGVLPGAQLKVTQAWPGIVFRMGFSEFALDRELAGTIIVR